MASCDLLITGSKAAFIDVAVDRERIVDIGECRNLQADTTIDAHGLVLAPGFIDSHTHDDLAVLETPDLICKLSQGVTTVIAGNCGISLAPPPGRVLPTASLSLGRLGCGAAALAKRGQPGFAYRTQQPAPR